MKSIFEARRRVPVPRERYRAVARNAGLAPRLRHAPAPLDGAILFVAVAFLLFSSPIVGGVIGAGVADVGARLAELFPANAGTGTIQLPGGSGVVSGQPVSELPDYTRQAQFPLVGRVPAFAIGQDRRVAVSLNGAVVATVAIDPSGVFRVPLSLREGANTIELALVSASDVVARSTYRVTLDRKPPPLTLSRPVNGATVDGPTVFVQGTAEPGATVIVNDRTVVVAQDGSFSDSFTASPGALPITVLARDRAGNETTAKAAVTVKAPATSADLTVQVVLDRTTVKPGATVTAQVVVFTRTGPRADELVTLSVGVITIGSARTNAAGVAQISFAAPPNEGDAAVVVLASSASGRATLTVAR